MHRFWFWSGGLVVVLVLVMVWAAGLIPQEQFCDEYESLYVSVPEQTSTARVPSWQVDAHCQGVRNDLFFAQVFLGLGVALIGVGFVLRK